MTSEVKKRNIDSVTNLRIKIKNTKEKEQNRMDVDEDIEEGEASDDDKPKSSTRSSEYSHKINQSIKKKPVQLKEKIGKEKHASISAYKSSSKAIQKLYRSLGIDENDFTSNGWRPNALHVRGTERMTNQDVLNYFSKYSPAYYEYVNSYSCNVIWHNTADPISALLALTSPILERKEKISSFIQPHTTNEKTHKGSSSSEQIISKEKMTKSKKQKSVCSDDSDSDADSDDSSESSSNDESTSSSSSESSEHSGVGDGGSSSDSSDSSTSSSSSEDNDDDEEDKSKESTKFVKVKREKETQRRHSFALSSEDEDGVTIDQIGIPVPPGRWRLGIPCPKAEALLIRFAHAKDARGSFGNGILSSVQQSSAVESDEESFERPHLEKVFDEESREKHHKLQFEERRLANRHRKELSRRLQSYRQPVSEFDGPIVQRNYRDLDDPTSFPNNPWGEQAMLWGTKRREKQMDYNALLREHLTAGHKRTIDDVEECDYYSTSDEEDQQSDGSYDFNWRSKSKMPRMRMHADEEEKRSKRKKKLSRIQNRLELSRRTVPNREPRLKSYHTKSIHTEPSGQDLRQKIISQRNLRRGQRHNIDD